MKQNMCVTIDTEVYSWIKNKPGKISREVNKILLKEMIEEKTALTNYYQYSCSVCNFELESPGRSDYIHCLMCLQEEGKTIWMVEV